MTFLSKSHARALRLDPTDSRERALEAWEARQRLREVLRGLDQQLNAALLAWCEENGELENEMTGARLYAGYRTETKRIAPVREIVETVLEATGGDLDRFVETLSANAFKPGAVRQAVGEAAAKELYKKQRRANLAEGKPKKELCEGRKV